MNPNPHLFLGGKGRKNASDQRRREYAHEQGQGVFLKHKELLNGTAPPIQHKFRPHRRIVFPVVGKLMKKITEGPKDRQCDVRHIIWIVAHNVLELSGKPWRHEDEIWNALGVTAAIPMLDFCFALPDGNPVREPLHAATPYVE